MRHYITTLMVFIAFANVVAFDASVDIRDHVERNKSNVTDAYMIKNEAYPNESPFDAQVRTELVYANNSSSNHSSTVFGVNKYTYTDTSQFNISSNTSRLCVRVQAVNRTDTNASNNEACKTFIQTKNNSKHGNKTNKTSNKVNRTRDNKTQNEPVEAGQNKGNTDQNTSKKNTSKSDVGSSNHCRLLSAVPPVTTDDQSIKFTVNADQGSVTYWAENKKGEVVKSKVTTTNSGSKQYTPGDEDIVLFKASRDGCEQQVATTGVKATKTESYVVIDDVKAERPHVEATISHHHDDKRMLSLTTQNSQVAELNLPGGTTTFTTKFPASDLETGLSTLRAKAGDNSDSFKYRLQEEALKNRYPDLIDSVYHRKEYFGPTTVYVSLTEQITGELVVHQRNGVERRDINGSNLDITVMPTAPTERLGISVNNRLGETVDETMHNLDLERRDNTTSVTERTKESPDQTVQATVKHNTSSLKPSMNQSGSESSEAFKESAQSSNPPYVSAVGLLATLGYCAYWMRERI